MNKVVMLDKLKRLPTKEENDRALKIVSKATKSGVKIEIFRTYGPYDSVVIVESDGTDKSEELYLEYLHTVKPWIDVITMQVIDDNLYQKVSKKHIK
ncbi:MAG: hypothetical protein M1290_02950 [Candidatus Thermoplasmatota archaeon]|jgi:uncharacterized protein with GYD domain|nr:hypothetical protein [Candidatus Thermoplasmatota archaeon]MCL5789406.1 hypothetical protein [Candidatus Thermoplasmatota archaeon]